MPRKSAGVMLIGVAVACGVIAFLSSAPAQPAAVAPAAEKSFLEVGKPYTFAFPDGKSTKGKVLELPQAGWVKLEPLDNANGTFFFLNTHTLGAIYSHQVPK